MFVNRIPGAPGRAFATAFSVAVLLLFAASSSRAASLTYTETDSVQPIGWYLAGAISLPHFDPSLGTLNSITLSASEVQSGPDFNFQYNIPNGPDIVASTTIDQSIQIDRPDLSVLLPLAQSVTQSIDYSYNPSGNNQVAVSLPDASSSSITLTDASDLALFSGTGWGKGLVEGGCPDVSTDPNVNIDGITPQTESLTMQVTYDYTPAAVPEPGWLSLLAGAGLSAAGILRRRRGSYMISK